MRPDEPTAEQIDEPMLDAPKELPGLGAALGVEAFGNRAGEAADEVMENDEESHVPPSDNDGETVPG